MNTKLLQHSAALAPGRPRVLVTGASSGIGWELAHQLANAGMPVLALGRNPQRLGALKERHANLDTLVCDLQDLAVLPAMATDWVARYPDLGCLINNAGVQQQVRMDDAGYTAQGIRQEIDVNLTAPLLLAHALLPHFLSKASASIVNVTSGLGYVPKANAAVYSASKAGLHLFTQALRLQLQGSSVHVAEVVVPLVDTPMTQGRGRGKLTAAQAARHIIHGWQSGHAEIWVGKARALPFLHRWALGLLARVMQQS